MSNENPNRPRDEREPPPPPLPEDLQPFYPVCPYCGTDPAIVASAPFQMGHLTVLALFCSNRACRKILSLQVVGASEPQIAVPGARVRLN